MTIPLALLVMDSEEEKAWLEEQRWCRCGRRAVRSRMYFATWCCARCGRSIRLRREAEPAHDRRRRFSPAVSQRGNARPTCTATESVFEMHVVVASWEALTCT